MKKGEQLDFLYVSPKDRMTVNRQKKRNEERKPRRKSSGNTNKNINKKGNISKKKKKKKSKKQIIIIKLIKIFLLLALFIGGIIALLLSPLFNIKEIVIQNNEKIVTEEIINLSNIKIEDNMFQISKEKVKEQIKSNAYIDTVKITRKLPNIIVIQVKERQAFFQISAGTGYIYMDNQGYILEVSEERLQLPVIVGITDSLEVGKRIKEDDLKKLERILIILNAAKNKEIDSFISEIDVTNKNNYKLILEYEDKLVHLGDNSNLEQKMTYIKYFIEKEKGKKGEIIVDVDYSKSKPPYFREDVN